MSSRLAQALSLRYPPLALYYAAEDPPEAKSFKKDKTDKGGWGCALFLFGQALEGRTVSYSLETCRCPGAAGGLGLANSDHEEFPGGAEASAYFLSTGNENWEQGRILGRQMLDSGASREMVEEFLKGEGFKKNPELVFDYLKHLPQANIKGPFVILEPLTKALPDHTPEVVIMLADAVQLSALVYMANFSRQGLDNVRIPFGSGCQSIGLLPMSEAANENPRAVVGLTDISARLYMKKILGRDLLSFAMPWSLYQEMESNVEESFLTRSAWKKLHTE